MSEVEPTPRPRRTWLWVGLGLAVLFLVVALGLASFLMMGADVEGGRPHGLPPDGDGDGVIMLEE